MRGPREFRSASLLDLLVLVISSLVGSEIFSTTLSRPDGPELDQGIAIAVRNAAGRRRWSKLNELLGLPTRGCSRTAAKLRAPPDG